MICRRATDRKERTGKSVGMDKREEPVADIITELVEEASAALASRG